jgi:hypothetical protein
MPAGEMKSDNRNIPAAFLKKRMDFTGLNVNILH